MLGGLFVAFDGVWLIVYAAYLPDQVENTPYLPTTYAILGSVGIVLGIIIIFLATRLKSHPETSRSVGLFILILSIFSIFTGAGFFGLFFTFMGGLLAMTFLTREQRAQAIQEAAAQEGMAVVPAGQTSAGKACLKCGTVNPSGNAYCSKCGAQLPS